MHINIACDFVADGLLSNINSGVGISEVIVNNLLTVNGLCYRKDKSYSDIIESIEKVNKNFNLERFASMTSQLGYYFSKVLKIAHKYKVGDLVVVVSEFPKNDTLWCSEQEKYLGKTVTISKVIEDHHCYLILEDGRRWVWSNNMFLKKIGESKRNLS